MTECEGLPKRWHKTHESICNRSSARLSNLMVRREEHPRASFVLSTFCFALILTPFVLVRLYKYAISDIGAEPNPFPAPGWALFVGCAVAFTLSVICAFPFVLAFRLVVRAWSRRNPA